MNNYTHAYSQYVNHILNKSPSKTSYSFARAERFPDRRPEHLRTEIGMEEEKRFQLSPHRKRNSPQRKSQIALSNTYRGLDKYQARHLKRYPEEGGSSSRQDRKAGKSKSPIKIEPIISNYIKQRENGENRQQKRPSPINSATKSPSRSPFKKTLSPSNTHTQFLHEIDHVSKNETNRGYYPTGVQISKTGKYPVSTIKNTPVHSFGRSEERFSYRLLTSDPLGPGYYYTNFSEFGDLSKK